MMNYSLTDLKLFLAVAEEGSVSRGANRCHLSAPSASLRIKDLEEKLGLALFVRGARGVSLTVAGTVMLEHVRRCMAGLEQMNSDLLPYAQGLTTHLTFFANNNAINSFLPKDLSRFFAAYPTVRITLEERMGHEIVAAVSMGRADIGVVAIEIDHAELDFIPYQEDKFVLIVPASHRFAARQSIRYFECLSETWICLQSGSAVHTYLVNKATELGGRLDIRVQVAGFDGVTQLVSSGAGVAIVPMSILPDVRSNSIAILDLDEPWALRHHRVCLRKGAMASNTQLRNLVSILCER
ncbi:LysR family transcriptional regulator [Cupriavidus pauculus]|uniref:LysR family transcriptional regulator n=1 Tax=Cupriavidus pauculus TaxID=82633 RepID=UPI001EE38310|nr:LysR family transcriptional regulator [Cupriavidus pauculus]GJG94316.1 LysR family transcriptional regulator [Cupriavidus pauculus]